jgi:hypothetical protein
VLLLCSILLAIDIKDEVFPILEIFCEKQPRNPMALRLFIDYSLFYNNGIIDGVLYNHPEWLDAAQRLLKVDPVCDYALSLLVKFYECQKGLLNYSNL